VFEQREALPDFGLHLGLPCAPDSRSDALQIRAEGRRDLLAGLTFGAQRGEVMERVS
jgi:hypothetical protein